MNLEERTLTDGLLGSMGQRPILDVMMSRQNLTCLEFNCYATTTANITVPCASINDEN
jgi:hypothetical protein